MSQRFSLSESISWIVKVRMILPIVWCTLSTITFALTSGSNYISIEPVVGSIIVIVCKQLSLSFLPFMAYFQSPLLGVILYLPIRSIHVYPMIGFLLVWVAVCCSFIFWILETDTYDI